MKFKFTVLLSFFVFVSVSTFSVCYGQEPLTSKELKASQQAEELVEKAQRDLDAAKDEYAIATEADDASKIKKAQQKVEKAEKAHEKAKEKLEKELEKIQNRQNRIREKEEDVLRQQIMMRKKNEQERGIPLVEDTVESRFSVIEDPNDPKTWRWNKSNATRLSIRGDFDGDSFDENLFEGPTTLFSDNPEISQIQLDGDLGVYYLANEGDLDGDGGDEISFMTVYRDFSNINAFHIYTYSGNIWKELAQVKGHEWDCLNYTPKNNTERFTHEWKRKNKYDPRKFVLKQQDGVINVISIGPSDRYTIEHIKIINKRIAKRHWGEIIQPRHD